MVGEDGMAVFNDVAKGPEKLLFYQHRVDWSGELPVVNQAKAEPIPYEPGEPLKSECAAFLAALDGAGRPPTRPREFACCACWTPASARYRATSP